MNLDRFWQVVQESRRGARADNPDGNMTRQAAALKGLLSSLPHDEIRSFDKHFSDRMNDAYRWDLWGAAYIIGGGCSDDSFIDFRRWLISMGRDVFGAALADPESLVESANDPTVEECFFEEFDPVAQGLSRSGEEPENTEQPSEPAGEQWEDDDEELERLFPNLWNSSLNRCV